MLLLRYFFINVAVCLKTTRTKRKIEVALTSSLSSRFFGQSRPDFQRRRCCKTNIQTSERKDSISNNIDLSDFVKKKKHYTHMFSTAMI